MNAVLFNQNQRLVGSLIDAIEYYLYMFLYNKNNYLIFPGDNQEYKDMVLNLIKVILLKSILKQLKSMV